MAFVAHDTQDHQRQCELCEHHHGYIWDLHRATFCFSYLSEHFEDVGNFKVVVAGGCCHKHGMPFHVTDWKLSCLCSSERETRMLKFSTYHITLYEIEGVFSNTAPIHTHSFYLPETFHQGM